MEIKVKVEIGASSELLEMASKFLGLLKLPEVAIQPVVKAVVAEPVVERPEAMPQKDAESKAEEPQKESEGSKAEEAPKKLTEVDIRAAIDACRKRFCGEDYKNNPDTPEYKKYNKKLLAWFKEQAGILGAEDSKPSNLPAEQRENFINICNTTILGDNDEFTLKLPF